MDNHSITGTESGFEAELTDTVPRREAEVHATYRASMDFIDAAMRLNIQLTTSQTEMNSINNFKLPEPVFFV